MQISSGVGGGDPDGDALGLELADDDGEIDADVLLLGLCDALWLRLGDVEEDGDTEADADAETLADGLWLAL